MWAVYTNDANGNRIREADLNTNETKLGAECDMEWIAKYIYDDSAENAGLYVEKDQDMVNVFISEEFHRIVTACAFCGRWRDSLGLWVTPPPVVEVMVEMKIIELSHTYCAPCLRTNASTLGGQIAYEVADEQEAKQQMQPHDPRDLAHAIEVMFG